jgi:hypothetical protein
MKIFALTITLLLSLSIYGQDDLLDLLDKAAPEETVDYTTATFKGTRIVNMQSCEIPAPGVLQFMFMHRFGAFSDDFFYNFLGLDQAVVRLSLDYSFNQWLNVGIGRSSQSKTWDGFTKIKLLRQSKGIKNMPVTMVLYSTLNYSALRRTDNLPYNETDRLSYSHQLIMARKFNKTFSFQLVPTLVHFNFVETRAQRNTLAALGFGGRVKLNNRIAVTSEYMLQLPNNTFSDRNTGLETPYNNAFSIGFDIETGGHVFQLHFTNSRALADPLWIARTPGSWSNKDIFFGFNISRVFTVKKPETPDEPEW